MWGIFEDKIQLDGDEQTCLHLRIVQIDEHRFRLYGCRMANRLLSRASLPDMSHITTTTTPLQVMSVLRDHVIKLLNEQPKYSTCHQMFDQLQTIGWSNVINYCDGIITLKGLVENIEIKLNDVQLSTSISELYKERLGEQQQNCDAIKLAMELDLLYITAPGPNSFCRYLMLEPGVVELVDCRLSIQMMDIKSRIQMKELPLKGHVEQFECGICLSIIMNGNLPDISCHSCKKVYHGLCWRDWANNCQNARHAFGFMSVPCIFCDQDIEVKE